MLHILTLHWNKKASIKRLYDSFLPVVNDLNWKWHIKDNGSTDGSIEEIESWNNPNINLIKYPNNKDNYSKGMNFLFDQANSDPTDFILTLNNDVTFRDSNSLKNMISLMKKDKNIGLVGAKLNYNNSDRIQHCGVLFHPRFGLPYHYRSKLKEEGRDKLNRYYPAVTGAVSLTTSDIFAEVRFNEKLFWQFDDIYFNFDIRYKLNKEIVYCGNTNIWHEESSSLKTNPVHKMFEKQNVKLFIEAWGNQINGSLVNKYDQDINYNLYKE